MVAVLVAIADLVPGTVDGAWSEPKDFVLINRHT